MTVGTTPMELIGLKVTKTEYAALCSGADRIRRTSDNWRFRLMPKMVLV